ncbi:mitochondrial ribosomal protein S28 isoform X2 [Tachypleus tridentatus]|uniref:mitochondrial ribosomal protein S28 isoform X2 n=1 Tax=Tachypleus tridentatus TaxID=6853 RepID=UPI003FD5C46A
MVVGRGSVSCFRVASRNTLLTAWRRYFASVDKSEERTEVKDGTDIKRSGFAKAFEKFQGFGTGSENTEQCHHSFATLLRNSKFIQLGTTRDLKDYRTSRKLVKHDIRTSKRMYEKKLTENDKINMTTFVEPRSVYDYTS